MPTGIGTGNTQLTGTSGAGGEHVQRLLFHLFHLFFIYILKCRSTTHFSRVVRVESIYIKDSGTVEQWYKTDANNPDDGILDKGYGDISRVKLCNFSVISKSIHMQEDACPTRCCVSP